MGDVLARRRKIVKPDSALLAGDLATLGRNLLNQGRWSQAEPLLREALAIREKAMPDDWGRYDAMSLLGGAVLGQARYAEAEPLVVAGYQGTKAREPRIPVPSDSSCVRQGSGWCGCTRRGASPIRPRRGRPRSGCPTCPPTSSPRPERHLRH